ncbi:VanZ family protein, partial [Paenibacillus sp. TAF58]
MSWFVLALTVAVVGALALVAAGATQVKRRRSTWKEAITGALLWLWVWVVLSMTFGTRSGGGSALNLRPLDLTNHSDVVDFALNVLMFVPAGVLLAIRGIGFWASVAIVAGISLCIEVLQ